MATSTNKNTIGYETTYIVRADATDDAQKAILDKLTGIVKLHGGELLLVENWGRRKFGFPIEKETRGVYVYMAYTGDNKLVAELERNIRINEKILRYLSVKLGDDFTPAKFVKPVTPLTVKPAVEQHGDYAY